MLSKEFKRVVAISALASIELFTFFGSIHSPATIKDFFDLNSIILLCDNAIGLNFETAEDLGFFIIINTY
ncbi:hypothetical protein [Rickettsia montanensis]|uniref:hypothetical protein n=1 Tax=Rickettsia montanensis TaxID=33991 RepID=UPI00059D607E|nr:hypothetical protein [Rickettsia montanensis]